MTNTLIPPPTNVSFNPMKKPYDPHLVELRAQAFWDEQKSFKATEDLSKEKFYSLCMFPYPSGKLHMGHVRNYTIGDVVARYERMQGKNVLQPMGWDAFGLPAENAAIKNKVPPAKWTYENIDVMREQFKRMGFAYDWRREMTTCHPDYYRWEQWLFTKLFEKGLAYKKNAVVNWDPVDQTVLANEQVVDGKGWRSGAVVERKEISQWFLKITAYADELLEGLDTLEAWPLQVRTMQKNWIGRSHGVEISFEVANDGEPLHVYTTRHDTLMGATFIAIAAEHPIAKRASHTNPELASFIKECQHHKVAEAEMATLEKKGFDSGFKAIHPITGEAIPVWVANFVLMEYGSGAVMAVPAHDQRDYEFAKKYNLPIKQVLKPKDDSLCDLKKAAFCERGILIDSGEFNDLTSEQAFDAIADHLEKNNKGKRTKHYRLRDWGVSRQRYWGTPIPIIYCDSCGEVAVPEKDLPVILPEDIQLDGTSSPLQTSKDFMNTPCPKCGKPAKRETDTFDTFMESSWYYARFACPNQDKAMLDDRAQYWTPVDHYVGGVEHAVMHLLYARFLHKLMRDQNLLNSDEPFTKLLTQGMVLKNGVKMSKSKGNVVDPDALIQKYGADTMRLFIIFAAPPEQSLEWSDTGVEGANRFIKRLWSLALEHEFIKEINTLGRTERKAHLNWDDADDAQREIRRQIHQLLKQASFDYQRLQINTVVSACMKLLNLLVDVKADNPINQQLLYEGISFLLRLLAPIIPHITHELWHALGFSVTLIDATWPKVINEALKTSQIELVVQINGKKRAEINVPADAGKEAIQDIALADPNVQRFLNKQTPEKIIVVPNRLVNIVLGD